MTLTVPNNSFMQIAINCLNIFMETNLQIYFLWENIHTKQILIERASY